MRAAKGGDRRRWPVVDGDDGWASPGDLTRARRTEQRATATSDRNPSPNQTQVSPYNPIYGSFSLDRGG